MPKPVPLKEMWKLGGLSIGQLIRRSFAGFRKDQLDARCAQFAYYAVLAVAPILIVVIACVAQLPLDGVLTSFLRAIDIGMPDNVVALLEGQIRDIQDNSTPSLIAFGLLILAISGSKLFLTVGAGLDAAYGVEQQRRFWLSGGIAFALTMGILLLLLTAMVLLVVGPMVTGIVTDRVDIGWLHVISSAGVRWGVACGFMLVATSVMYWLVPHVKLRWYILSPGNVFATAGWVALTQLFRVYVENFSRYNETYGTLAGVVVLMIWLYLTGAILLMGGEINSVIHRAAIGTTTDGENQCFESAGQGN